MLRPIDKTKKSNIKCSHCTNWRCKDYISYCALTASKVNYWNRCKHFEWKETLLYRTCTEANDGS